MISRGMMNRQLYANGPVPSKIKRLALALNITEEEAGKIMSSLENPEITNDVMTSEDKEVMERLMLKQQGPDYQYNEENLYEGSRDLRAGGGIMSLTPRQEYGLGSIVKSVGKAVSGAVKGVTSAAKSIVSSDIGKAALLGAATFGIPGTSFGGFKVFNPVKQFIGGLSPFAIPGTGTAMPGGKFFSAGANLFSGGLGSLAKKVGSSNLIAAGLGFLGGAATTMLTPEQIQTGMGQDPAATRAYLRQYYLNLNPEATEEEAEQYALEQTREYAAKGGIMGVPTGEPRENQQGVKELDYRQEGGFVPVGIKEKADDVPAMLSKNEFVFTADAVRGAGNGDVEKGAERLYNTMKTLENGGTV